MPARSKPEDLRFHGRRAGHTLSKRRRRLIESLLPKLSIDVGSAGERRTPIAPADLFDRSLSEYHLEIGFGSGEHLIAQAEARPDTGFLGCEPFINGVAALLARIEKADIETIRIHADDVRLLLDNLQENSLHRVYLLFPDPWPKRRHFKRRFICPENLDRLAAIMADNAELRLATDHSGYAAWSLMQIRRHEKFDWPAQRPCDWRRRPPDWPITRYEKKALNNQRACVYLRFFRRRRH